MPIIPETDVYPRGTTYSYHTYLVSDGVTGEWSGEPTLVGVQEGITAGWFDTCRCIYPEGSTHEAYNFPTADYLGELIQ
tara:strand:- start:63 stop:299 length:237 start_codon:yes stop_codon:yes gene_type:complete